MYFILNIQLNGSIIFLNHVKSTSETIVDSMMHTFFFLDLTYLFTPLDWSLLSISKHGSTPFMETNFG